MWRKIPARFFGSEKDDQDPSTRCVTGGASVRSKPVPPYPRPSLNAANAPAADFRRSCLPFVEVSGVFLTMVTTRLSLALLSTLLALGGAQRATQGEIKQRAHKPRRGAAQRFQMN